MNTELAELQALIALKLVKGVGNKGALNLLAQFSSAQDLFNATPQWLTEAKLKPNIVQQIVQFDFSHIDPILAWADAPNRHIIPLGSALYPPLLTQITNPPILLFVIGNPELLLSPQIAIVGSRQPSAQGITNTQAFCESLCEQGLTITSGMANGVDGEAHRAALACNGYTIAVAGTGLNRVYPKHHRELAHQIAAKGALVSEKLPNEPMDGGSFPQRNRIIAGLSLGTLVVEAAKKSGTLITATYSLEAGREVFAIPGSIHNPLAKGCHNLIKQGAKLVECTEDILEDLPCIAKGLIDRSKSPQKPSLSKQDAELLKHIDYDITPLDSIIMRSQLTVEAATNKLLELELQGWVINSVGGYIRQ